VYSLSSQLTEDVRRRGNDSRVLRVATGLYALRKGMDKLQLALYLRDNYPDLEEEWFPSFGDVLQQHNQLNNNNNNGRSRGKTDKLLAHKRAKLTNRPRSSSTIQHPVEARENNPSPPPTKKSRLPFSPNRSRSNSLPPLLLKQEREPHKELLHPKPTLDSLLQTLESEIDEEHYDQPDPSSIGDASMEVESDGTVPHHVPPKLGKLRYQAPSNGPTSSAANSNSTPT